MKKILYHGFINHNQNVIDILNKKYNWKPVVNVSIEKDKRWFEKNFSNFSFLDIPSLRRFEFEKFLNKIKINSINIDELDLLNVHKVGYFGSFDETKIGNFSLRELKNLFIEYLSFWKSILIEKKVDIVIFLNWPHRSDCYSLYLIAKYVLKLDVLFIDQTPHLDKYYQTIGKDLNQLHLPFMKHYLNGTFKKNNQNVEEYVNKLKKKQTLKVDVEYIINRSKINIFFDFIKRFTKVFILTLLRGEGFKKPLIFLKKNTNYYKSSSYLMNNFEYLFFCLKKNIQTKKLKKYYEKNCTESENNENYVLFAAPFQPEVNTNALVGNSEDVITCLEMISKLIPKDWKIYYKEHFSTFLTNDYNRSSLIKDKNYYERIKKINNIRFISSKESIYELIKKSKVTASVSGTSSFEAAINEIPSISFGNCWYMGCKSILTINSFQDIKKAFEKINNGFKPSIDDIYNYLYAISSSSIKELTYYKHTFDRKKISEDELKSKSSVLADFLYSKYNEYYPDNEKI